jgi:hypothetical protein
MVCPLRMLLQIAANILLQQDHNLLVSELQTLIVESKRRHTDVKDVSGDDKRHPLIIAGRRESSGDT